MINQTEFELYQNYRQLQEDYRNIYKRLKQQYMKCELEGELLLFTLSIEIADLKAKVACMEEQIAPEIGTVLTEMQIRYVIATDGTIILIE